MKQLPSRRLATPLLCLGVLALSILSLGCGSLGLSFGNAPERASRQNKRRPPSAEKAAPDRSTFELLDRAFAALERDRPAEALQLAREAREKSAGKRRRGETNGMRAQAMTEATVAEGLAHRKLGDPVKAVLSIGENPIAANQCRSQLLERCVEHAAFVYGAPYRHLTRPNGGSSAFAQPVAGVDLVVLGGIALTTSDIDFLKNKIPKDADWVAVWVTTSKKTKLKTRAQGEKTAFSMVGSNESFSARSCQQKVGEVAIRGRNYDVNRCSTNTYHNAAATLSFNLPAEEASQVDLNGGKRALIAFRARALRGSSSSVSTLGDARLVQVK